ncbi:N-acetyl-L,L-diaminopimelate-like deacetylase [Liberibacter crescens BT-1]|uniref:N-acetyl-L,L-diaminopimelate-like deacetylase n=1 Tax=Liberibacter crescens (strain BT-1) TaxID=1215343 RepID=L0EWC4_LIBCB|nr:amidohydrolase [Liberibacter crescens]AGA64676.1 N-acetyl-L,L-diaminopimelate-like deacetylase [Liberibacter crescens BT-1]AMC12777.1 hydrolase [Liberibacter crescens]
MDIASEYEELARETEVFRHELHQFPELSNEEFQTTSKIRNFLQRYQIRILDLQLRTGIVAEVGPETSEFLVILRADIDALPITEENDDIYTSQYRGVMHACGHDFHTSVVLGAAVLLKKSEAQLKGCVRILFQPAEEIGTGALELVAAGALEGAAAIFGIHNDPTLPVGVIGSKEGALTACVDRFKINIHAEGTHAARPQDGKDPVIIAGQIINVVQTLVSRSIGSDQNAVVSITQVHSGSTWNVIPNNAYLEGTVRTFNQQTRFLIEKKFRQLLQGLASAFEAIIELDWQAGPPSVVNDIKWTDFSLKVAKSSGFETCVVEPTPIGEDFAFYQQIIPGAFMMIGSGGPYPLHHPKFKVDDKVLFPAARYLANLTTAALIDLSKNA